MWPETVSSLPLWLGNVLLATMARTFSTSQLPKVIPRWCVLYILNWKCAWRHNGEPTFRHRNFKSGPNMWCFYHFDLEMCLAPQRHALFQRLNFQKWSDVGVLCTFWLGNVLRATTACTFSTYFNISTSKSGPNVGCFGYKCASRRKGAQFFISHLATWLRTRRFSEPTFRHFSTLWSHKSVEKHSESRLSYLFVHLHLLSSLSFSSLIFSLLLLSDSSHLCFSICPYCRKFDF